MTHTLGLTGVPSSAGAHWPGQEQTPAALRAAGLIARLRAGASRLRTMAIYQRCAVALTVPPTTRRLSPRLKPSHASWPTGSSRLSAPSRSHW
jgi:hypothetical protein